MKGIYFEEKGEELLETLGISKSEFARMMGIHRQNVKALFRTNNIGLIARAAEVLDVPLALLVGYVEEPDRDEYQIIESADASSSDDGVIRPEDVPVGDSTEDRRERNRLIRQFYYQWLNRNDSRKVFNRSLHCCPVKVPDDYYKV